MGTQFITERCWIFFFLMHTFCASEQAKLSWPRKGLPEMAGWMDEGREYLQHC